VRGKKVNIENRGVKG